MKEEKISKETRKKQTMCIIHIVFVSLFRRAQEKGKGLWGR